MSYTALSLLSFYKKVCVTYSDLSSFVVGSAWQLICQASPWQLFHFYNPPRNHALQFRMFILKLQRIRRKNLTPSPDGYNKQ
jgi:hypothetical protein